MARVFRVLHPPPRPPPALLTWTAVGMALPFFLEMCLITCMASACLFWESSHLGDSGTHLGSMSVPTVRERRGTPRPCPPRPHQISRRDLAQRGTSRGMESSRGCTAQGTPASAREATRWACGATGVKDPGQQRDGACQGRERKHMATGFLFAPNGRTNNRAGSRSWAGSPRTAATASGAARRPPPRAPGAPR